MKDRAMGQDTLVGQTLSHYRVLEKIGAGGMGEVYRAYDEHLDREVAIKVLSPGTLFDDSSRKRFRKEALVISKLNHPNIATVHDFDTAHDIDFLVMEYVPGTTLSAKLRSHPLPEQEIVALGMQLAEGLSAAHEHGVVHRDVKPGNLRLSADGRLKILDFGLAKLRLPVDAAAATQSITEKQPISGTLPYMAPEQLLGAQADARTDIHAAGVVLYEMATNRHPFANVEPSRLIGAILRNTPDPPGQINAELSPELAGIIEKCLQKEPENRYQSARELALDLRSLASADSAVQERPTSSRIAVQHGGGRTRFLSGRDFLRPAILLPLLITVVVGYLAWAAVRQNRMALWARQTALPEAQRLIAKDDWAAAYVLASKAEKYLTGDPQLKEVMADTAILLTVQTDPPGADVFVKPYGKVGESWELLGRTPIPPLRISRGFREYRITKEGYDPVTGLTGSDQRLPIGNAPQIELHRTLPKSGTTPAGMVWVEGSGYRPSIAYFASLPQVQLDPFWMDEFETTNKEYQAFVDAGGYKNESYWKHEFVKQQTRLSWAQAMAEFTDTTGRSGPATWELGHYPEGQADYPASGVSWYEAAAYAEFAGKSLPTVYHWNKAAGVDEIGWNTSPVQPMITNSNFGASGAAAVGKFRGISPHGAFDMAGNLREWIWNGAPGGRYLLGGSWGTPEYLFYESAELLSPFDRSATNGFRCMRLLGTAPLPEAVTADVPRARPPSEFHFDKPVSDDVFKIYRSYYAYDKTPLDAQADPLDISSPEYVRQRVTFNAAYESERVIAYLYFPRNAKPPYQTVVIFPGTGALQMRSVEGYASINVAMFTRSGRAVVFPVYKGTFERPRIDTSTPTLLRDYTIMLYKDLARTLDYIETRPEFDSRSLAYFGLSWGAAVAPIFGAIDNRFKVFVLEGGGLVPKPLPEISPVNFAPHHKTPTVIINGRYDLIFPLETSAKPMLRFLGTPANDKALILFDGGHVPPIDSRLKKEMLGWLDRYLGNVR